MAVYDLEEQEQIDELKAWWKQYRTLILLVLVATALTVSSVWGWRAYRDRQTQCHRQNQCNHLKFLHHRTPFTHSLYACVVGEPIAVSGPSDAARLRLDCLA